MTHGGTRLRDGWFLTRIAGEDELQYAMKRHFYSKVLGGTLREKFEAAMATAPIEIDLLEELSLARATCAMNVGLLEVALEKGDPATQAAALENVRAAIDHVVTTACKAESVRRRGEKTIHVAAIQSIVNQIIGIVQTSVPLEAAREIEEQLNDIVVPADADVHRRKRIAVEYADPVEAAHAAGVNGVSADLDLDLEHLDLEHSDGHTEGEEEDS